MNAARLCAIAFAVSMAGCGDSTGPEACASPSILLSGDVCLDLRAAGGLDAHRTLIRTEVERTLAAVRAVIPLTDLRVSIVADPTGVIPEIGLGGFAPNGDEVRIFGDPGLPSVPAIVSNEMLRILAHEIHHALRWREIGYGSTLLQAAVSEGLADHFALEVGAGEVPPWSSALTQEQLNTWLPQVVAQSAGSYDHARWFYGSTAIVPRWTGYAVGFELVRQYLERNSGERPSGLVGEDARSFVPPGPS